MDRYIYAVHVQINRQIEDQMTDKLDRLNDCQLNNKISRERERETDAEEEKGEKNNTKKKKNQDTEN